jgi:hypothetical protein
MSKVSFAAAVCALIGAVLTTIPTVLADPPTGEDKRPCSAPGIAWWCSPSSCLCAPYFDEVSQRWQPGCDCPRLP